MPEQDSQGKAFHTGTPQKSQACFLKGSGTDVLMLTRGILRSVIPPSVTKPVVIRASGGPSILKELSDEQEGASGVDMGRNVFQSDSPVGMMRALQAVVHGGESPDKAYDLYRSVRG